MSFLKFILIIALLAVSSALPAQSLLDVYQAAKLSDPTWLGQIARNTAAREATVQSRSNFLPNIRLSADTTSNFNDSQSFQSSFLDRREKYNSNGWTLSITQPIFRMSNYAQHRLAKVSVQRADAELAASAQDLMLRVARTYFDILTAESELTAAEAEKTAIERQLDQVRKRFEVGLVAITDVHEAQASFDLAIANELVAQNELLLAKEALSEITGDIYGSLDGLKEEIRLAAPEPDDIDEWVKRAIENNHVLAASQAAVEAARQNIKRQESGHYPTLDLVATGQNSTSHSRNSGGDTDREIIGLQFTLPVYSGGLTSSRVQQAMAELQQAKEELIRTRRSIEKQARNAYLNVISDISRIQALRQAMVSSQSALDATEAGFEVGTRTIVDVLNAQRILYNSISDFQRARHDYIINSLELKQASGLLSGDDIHNVDQMLEAD